MLITTDVIWDKYPAFNYIKSLRAAGEEWYLPSAEEFELIFENITVINSALSSHGKEVISLGTTAYCNYLTSTEVSSSNVKVISGAPASIKSLSKSEGLMVRAVKKIK